MKTQPVQQWSHDKLLWINPTTEAIRKEECECLNCKRFKPDTDAHCHIAADFYEVIKKHGNKFLMVGCHEWEPKKS